MDLRREIEKAQAFSEMIVSLASAVQRAGGSVESICDVEHLKHISAFELLMSLAPNDIKFVCTKNRSYRDRGPTGPMPRMELPYEYMLQESQTLIRRGPHD